MIIFKERLILTLLLFAGLMLVTVYIIKPQPVWGNKHYLFYKKKLNTPPIHNIVIAGDSRVLRDLSPLELGREIGLNYKITNFGFSFTGLNSLMYPEIEKKLLADDSFRMILIGIGPRMFLESLSGNPEMVSYREASWFKVITAQLNKYLIPTSFPLAFNNIKRAWSGTPLHGFFEEEREHGWLAGWRYPLDENRAEEFYLNTFKKEKVSSTIINATFKQLKVWRQKGIRVVGFRPPISPRIYQIEQQLSNFDERDFVAKWRANGGDWLDMPMVGYKTYDGSHLEVESAIKFSRAIGLRLKQEQLLTY
jgi:hypothetical protein